MRILSHILLTSYFLLTLCSLNAQVTLSNNGVLVIQDSQLVKIEGNLINKSENFENHGDVRLTGILTSTHPIKNQGEGIFRFVGDVEQIVNLFAPCSMYNVEIDNSAGVIFLGDNNMKIHNNMNFSNGQLRTYNESMLVFDEGSYYKNASNASHVEGPVQKIGQEEFIFPVGRADTLRPIIISNLTAYAIFQAEYFNRAHDTLKKDVTLETVSNREYWDLLQIEGDAEATVTLTYNPNYDNLYDEPDMARFNDSLWTKVDSKLIDSNNTLYKLSSSDHVKEFSSFTFAEAIDKDIYLFTAFQNDFCEFEIDWIAATDKGQNAYTLEYSVDSINFEVLTTVIDDPNIEEAFQAYKYIIREMITDNEVYFRLRLTKTGGLSSEFSAVVMVKNFCKSLELSLFPNPVRASENIYLAVYSEEDFDMQTRIVDTWGQILNEQVLHIQEGQGKYTINTTFMQLAAATYYLQIETKGKNRTFKFVVLEDR